MATTILATIFVLGILVFVHEMGHFSAAKVFGIRVDRFSLGYPPRMVGKKIGDTDYCISWIPFGGYVKIAGMVDESLDKESLAEAPKPWEYRSRPWLQRFSVILAGPLMNLGFAFVVFAAATWVYGVGEVSGSRVGSVVEGKPAEKAGIRPGDRIVSVDGREVATWEALAEIIHGAPGQTIRLTWMREDTVLSGDLVPEREKIAEGDEIREVGLIGIGPLIVQRRAGFLEGFTNAGRTMYYFSRLVLVSIAKLVTGRESVRSLAGPVFIARLAGESARSGWGTLIGFMAFLSLNLGILNLLPIPVLDGGHLVFLSIEGVIRRPIPLKVRMVVQQVGMVLILGLMLFVVYNDILRIVHR